MPHQSEEGSALGERFGEERLPGLMGKEEKRPPDPQHRTGDEQAGPEYPRDERMQPGEPGVEYEDQRGRDRKTSDECRRRPGEEEPRRRIKVAAVRERPAVPLVPLMPEAAVDIDVNELSPVGVRHTRTR